MKTKFLLPVLAAIFAIGMSFTTLNSEAEQAVDYIRVNNNWQEIPEINCGEGPRNCQVKMSDGSIHNVYDTQNLSSLKDTNSTKPFQL